MCLSSQGMGKSAIAREISLVGALCEVPGKQTGSARIIRKERRTQRQTFRVRRPSGRVWGSATWRGGGQKARGKQAFVVGPFRDFGRNTDPKSKFVLSFRPQDSFPHSRVATVQSCHWNIRNLKRPPFQCCEASSAVARPHHDKKGADSHLACEPICKSHVGPRFVVDSSFFPRTRAKFTKKGEVYKPVRGRDPTGSRPCIDASMWYLQNSNELTRPVRMWL